jgi:hypothetical protein
MVDGPEMKKFSMKLEKWELQQDTHYTWLWHLCATADNFWLLTRIACCRDYETKEWYCGLCGARPPQAIQDVSDLARIS